MGVATLPDNIEAWQKLKRELSRDKFVERFDHPFLLRAAARTVQRPEARATLQIPVDDWAESVGFQTGVVEAGIVPKRPSLRGATVHRIVKAPSNPFPDRISIGRAANCDIVLKDPTVSKLHAHFRAIVAGLAELVDARSHNGTKLNGRILEAGKGEKVVSGDLLMFGATVVEFLEPARLYDLL